MEDDFPLLIGSYAPDFLCDGVAVEAGTSKSTCLENSEDDKGAMSREGMRVVKESSLAR